VNIAKWSGFEVSGTPACASLEAIASASWRRSRAFWTGIPSRSSNPSGNRKMWTSAHYSLTFSGVLQQFTVYTSSLEKIFMDLLTVSIPCTF
jgi:hypothetical protein